MKKLIEKLTEDVGMPQYNDCENEENEFRKKDIPKLILTGLGFVAIMLIGGLNI